jgi:hypothetical protein
VLRLARAQHANSRPRPRSLLRPAKPRTNICCDSPVRTRPSCRRRRRAGCWGWPPRRRVLSR